MGSRVTMMVSDAADAAPGALECAPGLSGLRSARPATDPNSQNKCKYPSEYPKGLSKAVSKPWFEIAG